MVTLSNIFGPQGMIGYIGNVYDFIIKRYEKQGFSMVYETETGIEIKIEDMNDNIIKNCMTTMRTNALTEVGRAWFDIFTDVLMKRRLLKLEKIKTVINEKENKK